MMPYRIHLQTPTPDCEPDLIAAVNRSNVLHNPWVYPPSSHEGFTTYMERIRTGRTVGFLLRRNSDDQLAGVVNISEPVMGTFRSAYLGFYAFTGFERQGYITEGLALVLDRAFNELEFHRLEANIQPANRPSTALVSRLGFRKEGYSPQYLFIDGAWRDHDRWAILSDEWPDHRRRLFASRSADKRQSRNG